ncbi:MAG: hypothetical protein AB7U45_10995 [Desulfamplus sp.]
MFDKKMMLYTTIITTVLFLVLTITWFCGQQQSEITKSVPLKLSSLNFVQTFNQPTKSDQTKIIIQPQPAHDNLMAQLENVLKSEDIGAIQSFVDEIADCHSELEHISNFFDDPFQNTSDKIALGKALMQPANEAEIFVLVNAVLNAHFADDSELKDGLISALGYAQTTESVSALIAIIGEGISGIDFHKLPDELQFAIKNAIRLNPFPEAAGQMLVEYHNNQASPEAALDIESIQQPVMLSMLTKQAYDSGDIERVEKLTHTLSKLDNPYTLDGLMLLGTNGVLPLDKVNEIAYIWANEHGYIFKQDRYEAYLSEFNTNEIQRSVAAFALAGSQNPADAAAALEKALIYETDAVVSSNIEIAVNLVLKDY